MATNTSGSGGMSNGSGHGGDSRQGPSDDGRDEDKPTGRTEPRSINEQIAMKAAIADAENGKVLTRLTLTDPRWLAKDGWVKMRYYHESTKIVIHYVRNTKTGQSTDFKYKDYEREN